MAQDTTIEWTDHTFNPWIGCTKVSPGCAHCYAETLMDTRLHQVNWGPGQPRKRTSESNWNKVRQWDRQAAETIDFNHPTGDAPRPRIFCASLADWLDPEVPLEWLADLLDLIRLTPHLDWLLLTKRPQLFRQRMGEVWHDAKPHWEHNYTEGFYEWMRAWTQDLTNPTPPANVWIGTTVEDQKRAAERIPQLLNIPAKVRFLSCEPLLGPLDLLEAFPERLPLPTNPDIHWIIAGGESGPNARPMHPDWARYLRNACHLSGTPFLFKQWGEWAPSDGEKDKGEFTFFRDGTCVERVGKKSAGRELDGQIHHDFPIPS